MHWKLESFEPPNFFEGISQRSSFLSFLSPAGNAILRQLCKSLNEREEEREREELVKEKEKELKVVRSDVLFTAPAQLILRRNLSRRLLHFLTNLHSSSFLSQKCKVRETQEKSRRFFSESSWEQ